MTTTAEGWPGSADPWDRLLIGGRRMPVPWRMRIARPVRPLGRARLDIKATMSTPEEWKLFRRFIDSAWPREATSRAVYHPACAIQKIRRVVVTGISVPSNGRRRGTKVVTIKCREYIAPGRAA